MNRRRPGGLRQRQIVGDTEGVEDRGQTGVKNFIEGKDIDTHGRNYTIIVNLATCEESISPLESASRSSTSERKNHHGKSCPVRTLGSQTRKGN